MSGPKFLCSSIAFVVVAYVLALIFVVPATAEARAVATVLFAWTGLIANVFGFIIWRSR